MTRGKPRPAPEETERKCLVTCEVSPKRGLIRFVVGPGDIVYPDVAGKLPGRGMYVSSEREALETAVAKRLFSRGAKRQVSVPEGLVDQVEEQLAQRCVNRLGLARKAGKAIAGFEKVKDWLEKDQCRILLQASDGSERGKSKLFRPGGRGSFFDILTADELGLSFGRERVIHAALAAGRLAEDFRDDAVRLSGVRKTEDQGGDAGKVKKT
ncbi:RNA-binding protein [Palleronia caenipelagi]|uniref:RNA-binding protein n=1 Tax=Palleronia caenipelagi TaxID=2489174 RepID=A0A547Q6F0_9RHOB|nr:RNA-binding protein [Palleronia caenipelagi]TRD21966.1 RNA-binding protein [Palleronia caenipelagi]